MPTEVIPAPPEYIGIAKLRAAMEELKTIRTFVLEELREGVDFGVIPGTGQGPARPGEKAPERKVLFQPGAQKVAMLFGSYPEHSVVATELPGGHVEYLCTTRIISRATGLTIGSGIGSATTMEKKYRWRGGGRTCPACGKGGTILKSKQANRDGSPPGWYCFAKIGGCGAQYRAEDREICDQDIKAVENPDIADLRNTVLKIGTKRSFVNSAMALGCLSDLFTQDIEDTYDITLAPAPDPAPAAAAAERSPRAHPEPGPDRAQVPAVGKLLFAWVKEQEQLHEVGLLKYLNGWAKLQDFPARMIDWDDDQIARAHAEANRKIDAIRRPGRAEGPRGGEEARGRPPGGPGPAPAPDAAPPDVRAWWGSYVERLRRGWARARATDPTLRDAAEPEPGVPIGLGSLLFELAAVGLNDQQLEYLDDHEDNLFALIAPRYAADPAEVAGRAAAIVKAAGDALRAPAPAPVPVP